MLIAPSTIIQRKPQRTLKAENKCGFYARLVCIQEFIRPILSM